MAGSRDQATAGPRRGWRRGGWLLALGALAVALGCAHEPRAATGGDSLRARSALRAGAGLYEAGEYVRAARAFEQAAFLAGDRELRRRATAAECIAWLRARQLPELGECSARLQSQVRRERHSDPGVNTLIAMGAIAAQRPAPPYKIPAPIEKVLRAAADEGRR